MIKRVTSPSHYFIACILVTLLFVSSCTNANKTDEHLTPKLESVPILIGESPVLDGPAFAGTWRTNNLVLTSDGKISGQITIDLVRPVNNRDSHDLLMVQVWAVYIWPHLGDTTTEPISDVIPVFASESSNTSATFDIRGGFTIPPLKQDIDGGLPLYYINVTMNWRRVSGMSQRGYGYYPVKIGIPQKWYANPLEDLPLLDQTISVSGTVDTNTRGDFTYTDLIPKLISIPTLPTSPLVTP